MCIWSRTLTAFDVGVHVICDGCLDSLRRDSTLKAGTWPIPRTGGAQFIENELVHMVVIPVHHRDHLVEIPEDGV
jgi:hypothetical protein